LSHPKPFYDTLAQGWKEMFPPKACHDLYARFSVAVELWKAMGGGEWLKVDVRKGRWTKEMPMEPNQPRNNGGHPVHPTAQVGVDWVLGTRTCPSKAH